ncbi:MAG TPA: hypothetical protein VFH61_13835 [Thermoleophilia bacterium]|nr:hypothetical protein [Thermoleophilia bacterium]
MRKWPWIAALLLTGCATPAPVVDALDHQVEDLQLLERELLPLVPADTEMRFGAKTLKARLGWQIRLRAFQARAEALRAWARGERYDLAAAQTRLFGVGE